MYRPISVLNNARACTLGPTVNSFSSGIRETLDYNSFNDSVCGKGICLPNYFVWGSALLCLNNELSFRAIWQLPLKKIITGAPETNFPRGPHGRRCATARGPSDPWAFGLVGSRTSGRTCCDRTWLIMWWLIETFMKFMREKFCGKKVLYPRFLIKRAMIEF